MILKHRFVYKSIYTDKHVLQSAYLSRFWKYDNLKCLSKHLCTKQRLSRSTRGAQTLKQQSKASSSDLFLEQDYVPDKIESKWYDVWV